MVRTVATARMEGAAGLLESLRFALDDARLAAGICSVGPVARPYSGQPFGRMADLARHAARMRADWWIQWIDAASAGAAGELARCLLSLRPETKFLWWGPCVGSIVQPTLKCGAIHTVDTASPQEVLEWMSAAGLIPVAGIPTEGLPSPYLSGLLTPADGLRLGLTADQPLDLLEREVDWLCRHGLGASGHLPVDVSRAQDARIAATLEFLSRVALPFSFELVGYTGDINPNMLHQLLSARVKRVSFARRVHADQLAALAEAGIDVIDIDDLGRDLEVRRTNGINGTIAMFSGLYPDLDQGVGVTHFGLGPASGEERTAACQWVGPNLRLRSAGVLALETQELQMASSSHASMVVREMGGWPSHLYEIVRNPDGAGVVRFDGTDQAMAHIRFLPYASKDEAESQVVTVLNVRALNDVESLESDLKRFHESGVIHTYHPSRQFIVENTCRWRGWGGCSLLSMRRLSVVSDGQLSACGDAGTVGTVGEAFDQMVARQKQALQMAEILRGCSTCPVRDECSHCIHLPEAWTGRYCEIRRAYPHASLYFELCAFPHLIAKFLVDNGRPVTLEVSASGLPWNYQEWTHGKERPGLRPVIITVFGLHFAWIRGTTKVTRLSEPLAVLLEGWWAGGSVDELRAALRAKFGVEQDAAEAGVRDGLPRLQAGGLCYD